MVATLWRRSFDAEVSLTGAPVVGAKLLTYDPGTSTPKPTYADPALTIPLPNPVVNNGAGQWPAVYLAPGNYRLVCNNPDDSLRWTVDPELTSEEVETVTPAAQAAAKNIIAGGEFWNVAAGPELYEDADTFTPEWNVLTETGDVSVARQTDQEIGQPVNLSLLQPDVGAKRIGAVTWVPTRRSRHLRGQQVVMSARVRASSGFRVRFAVLAWTGTADAPPADPIANWSSGVYGPGDFFVGSGVSVIATGSSLPPSFVWQDIAAAVGTVPVGTNNIGAVFWSDLGMAQNASLDLGLVQIELGTVPTAYERLSAVDIGSAGGAFPQFLLMNAGVI